MEDTRATVRFLSLFLGTFAGPTKSPLLTAPLGNPRWKTWYGRGTTIYSIFAKLAESLPRGPTNRTFCLFSPTAKERWWKSLEGRGIKRGKRRDARFSRGLTSLSYLRREIAGKRVLLSARIIFHFVSWRCISVLNRYAVDLSFCVFLIDLSREI